MRPGIGVILLDHAGGAEQLDGLLEHLVAQFRGRVFLGKHPVDELQLVGTTRHVGVQGHRADDAAVRLRDVDKAKENVGEHPADLWRHAGQHFQLIFSQVARQLLHHVGGHAGRRQCLELLLNCQLRRVEAGQTLDLAGQVNAAQRMAVGRADFDADHFRAEVGGFALALLGIVAHFAQPTVQGQRVEAIGGRLLARGFPVGVDDKALGWAEHFHALVGTTEQHVVVPFGIAEKLFK
ncbi:hypothetical protein D3C76_934600 [compost metagenome]